MGIFVLLDTLDENDCILIFQSINIQYEFISVLKNYKIRGCHLQNFDSVSDLLDLCGPEKFKLIHIPMVMAKITELQTYGISKSELDKLRRGYGCNNSSSSNDSLTVTPDLSLCVPLDALSKYECLLLLVDFGSSFFSSINEVNISGSTLQSISTGSDLAALGDISKLKPFELRTVLSLLEEYGRKRNCVYSRNSKINR